MKESTIRAMWLPKLLYVLATMAGTGWGRFQTIFFNGKGISPSTIGLLRGIGLVTKSMSYPMWGFIADCTGSIKLALIGTIICSTATLELFRGELIYRALWSIIIAQILRSASNSIWPLVDAFAIASIKKVETKESYGQQRLWCAISWGVSSLIVGVLIDNTDMNSIFYFTYAVVFLELFVVFTCVPRNISIENSSSSDNKTHSENNGGHLHDNHSRFKFDLSYSTFVRLSSFADKRLLIFFAMIFTYGMAMSVPETVLFLFMDNELKMSSTNVGLSLALSVLLEIPIFYYSHQLLSRHGPKNLMLIAQSTALIRMLAYLFVTQETTWMIYIIQTFHGMCFAGFWVPVVNMGQQMAPEGLGATAHTIVSSLYATLGHGVGGVFMGWLYEVHGIWYALIAGAVLLLIVLFLTSLLPDVEEKKDIEVMDV